MKKRLISCFLLLCMVLLLPACSGGEGAAHSDSASPLSALADPEEYYGDIFGQGEIIDVYVELSEEDWQDICGNAQAEEYHSADLTVNGITLENVGFRTKGFSSLNSVARSDSNRYGFKIKTDEYVDDQTLNGLDMFVLNGCFADPSYMREYLTYAASEFLGCDTPCLAYTNLYINGELFGFYLCIEAYDDSFVERYTDSDDTVLYKAEGNCTLLTGDDGSGFDVEYGRDDEYTNIKKLISVLSDTTGENKEALEAILDVDSVLKAAAVNTVMGNYDSYSGSKAHNYYLLYTDGIFTYVGWDYNMSIGGFPEDNGASVTVDVTTPVYGADLSQRPLIQKLLAVDEYRERYLAYIGSLAEYFSGFEGMVSGISDTIREYVAGDPSSFFTIDQYDQNITASGTDLSQTAAAAGRQQRPAGDGQMQAPQDRAFRMPDGQAPAMGDGQTPAMPDGQAPVMGDGQTPAMPDGQAPVMGDGQARNMQRPNNGGGIIGQDTVSIVDYILQRIDNIKTQLNLE